MLVLHRPDPLRRPHPAEMAGDVHADGDVRGQRGLHGDVIGVARRPGDRLVEAPVLVGPELAIAEAGFQGLQRILDLAQILRLPAFGGQRRGNALEPGAELEAALDIGQRADLGEAQHRQVRLPPDIGAGALARDHQPVLPQPPQRLAHHRPRRAEARRQLRFRRQPAVHGEVAMRDQGDDAVIDHLAQPGRRSAVRGIGRHRRPCHSCPPSPHRQVVKIDHGRDPPGFHAELIRRRLDSRSFRCLRCSKPGRQKTSGTWPFRL